MKRAGPELKLLAEGQARGLSRRPELKLLDTVIRASAVATTLVDIVALLGRRAHAAAIAAEGRRAALRLALVIFEDEEVVGTNLELRARKRLIRGRSAPLLAQTETIERTDPRGRCTRRIRDELVNEPLTVGTGRLHEYHEETCNDKKGETSDKKLGVHSVRYRLFYFFSLPAISLSDTIDCILFN